jgi:GMP synthase PP-ATPase subunit
MGPTTFESQWGPLEATYMSSMSHTSDTDIANGNYASKFKEFPSCDNVGGLGGQNHTLRLVNPLTNLFPDSKPQHLSVMKP